MCSSAIIYALSGKPAVSWTSSNVMLSFPETEMTETDSFNRWRLLSFSYVFFFEKTLIHIIFFLFDGRSSDLNPNEQYRMNHKRRGLALIFNHERFYWRLGMNSRSGTNADRHSLEKRYPSLTPPLWFLEEHVWTCFVFLQQTFWFLCFYLALPEPIFLFII